MNFLHSLITVEWLCKCVDGKKFYVTSHILLHEVVVVIVVIIFYRVLAFSTNSFHLLLSWARVFQFGTFIFCMSFLTSCPQHVFGLPIGFLEMGFHLNIRLLYQNTRRQIAEDPIIKRLFISGAEVRKNHFSMSVVCQNCNIIPTYLLETIFTVLPAVSSGD